LLTLVMPHPEKSFFYLPDITPAPAPKPVWLDKKYPIKLQALQALERHLPYLPTRMVREGSMPFLSLVF
jgi:hypothetical protein